jgi:TolB protein
MFRQLTLALALSLTAAAQTASSMPTAAPDMHTPEEKHLRNVHQLTFGGTNAEAYFSYDGKKLIFQTTREKLGCDQIYMMNTDGSDQHMVSTGQGRTTCSYFFKDGKRILYASTHKGGKDCPPRPDYSKGYVWAIYPTYQIFTANPDGSDVKQLTNAAGYNAEATVSPDGKKIVFTSTRDGDLDLYSMDIDGKNVKRLTTELGYDGGAFFSPDGKWIVFRAYHPKTEQEIKEYKELLAQNLIRPSTLEIWIMRADGSGKRQITSNGAANFAPFFYPNGKRIIFSSNYELDKKTTVSQGNFELWAVDLDGKNLERITFSPGFDGFPIFSPDGKKLVFASNRNAKAERETNIFIADWVE